MPSNARTRLDTNLNNIVELRSAHVALTGGGRGAPAIANGQRQGAAITKAGVVMLSAAFEAFVEDLFDEALPYVFPTLSAAQLQALMSQSSGKMNNADCAKIEWLYTFINLQDCLNGINWQKYSNATLKKNINQMVHIRNCIAHGGAITDKKKSNTPFNLLLKNLKSWETMVRSFAPRFEAQISAHIAATTGNPGPW